MQPLSEAWATAYVQILITIIIFALGIPALTVQLLQEDIRTVVHRLYNRTFWLVLMALMLIAFFIFIWILHPPFNRTSKESALNIPVSVARAAGQNAAAENFILTVGSPQNIDPDTYDYMAPISSPVAAVLMTVIPLGLLITALFSLGHLRRQEIIKILEELSIEGFEESSTPPFVRRAFSYMRNLTVKKKPARKRRSQKRPALDDASQKLVALHLDKENLEDLIYLGITGRPGKDKQLVLDALDRLACLFQESATYQGDELETLIWGLKDILVNGEQPGNDYNFIQAVEILKNLKLRLSKNPATSMYIDAGRANSVLQELGLEAIKTKSGPIADRFLEEASASSEILFEMGLTALSNRRFHTATLALNKLETLAEGKGFKACSATFDLLGLLAHFMFGGTASEMRANTFLSDHIADFSDSIDDCLEKAFDYHYENSSYDTADMVFQLRETITSNELPL